jgi:hypothetical protein
MEQIRTRVAGLDVHRDSVTACARVPDEAGHLAAYRRKFKTTTTGLGELAVWLAAQQVQLVVMESTGVYWKAPVRHEALLDREGVRDPLLRAVAAVC